MSMIANNTHQKEQKLQSGFYLIFDSNPATIKELRKRLIKQDYDFSDFNIESINKTQSKLIVNKLNSKVLENHFSFLALSTQEVLKETTLYISNLCDFLGGHYISCFINKTDNYFFIKLDNNQMHFYLNSNFYENSFINEEILLTEINAFLDEKSVDLLDYFKNACFDLNTVRTKYPPQEKMDQFKIEIKKYTDPKELHQLSDFFNFTLQYNFKKTNFYTLKGLNKNHLTKIFLNNHIDFELYEEKLAQIEKDEKAVKQ